MRMRVDTVTAGSSKAWAIGMNIPWLHPQVSEILILGYRLGDDAERHLEGASHELALHGLDQSVAIDFTESLFEQKRLKPWMPLWLGYQFAGKTDGGFVAKMVRMSKTLRMNMFSPRELLTWDSLFPDGLPLHDSYGACAKVPDQKERVYA